MSRLMTAILRGLKRYEKSAMNIETDVLSRDRISGKLNFLFLCFFNIGATEWFHYISKAVVLHLSLLKYS